MSSEERWSTPCACRADREPPGDRQAGAHLNRRSRAAQVGRAPRTDHSGIVYLHCVTQALCCATASGAALQMIDSALTPTRLVRPEQRGAVPIRPVVPLPRFYTVRMAWRFAAWALVVGARRLTGRLTPEQNARHLVQLLDRWGGLWIMVGQLLSKASAISPDVRRRARRSRRIRRRVGSASARNARLLAMAPGIIS